MSLTAGRRIGAYEITGELGAGGMGEVYRARDTRLKRDVAMKMLPQAVATDPDRLARFQREAEVLASLNHPNIAQIHGLEESDGIKALVMELVEGPTLADRIADVGRVPPSREAKRGGPAGLPIDEALAIARQIADALEAAHEQGIIHRDLKPANIKVRDDGTVKVLDFGLAKLIEAGSGIRDLGSEGATASPTITSPALMTGVGVILGTAAYMSPEQARGKAVDKRADIWAFGCVLYEMLAGQRAFDEEDVSMTLSKVLQREPDFDALPGVVPARVRQTLHVCLRKDPKQRIGDIRDVRLALEGAFETVDPHAPEAVDVPKRAVWQRPVPLALAASLAAAVVAGVAVWSLVPVPERPVSRFEYTLPAGQQFRSTGRPLVALSRDGRRVVYNTQRGLYLRALDEFEAHVVPGTEGGNLTSPFFSPDGQSVGYWQDGQLKRIAVTGGAPVVIGPAENPFGVSWETDNTILFGQSKGIMRVPATGGTPELVIPAKDGEQFHGPQLLTDGDSVLFSATSVSGPSRWDGAQVVVQSLRSSEREVVLQGGSDARFVSTGHLVYALEDGLFALPFDADTRRVTGVPVSMAQSIRRATGPAANTASANYGVSEQGTLVYVKSTPEAGQGTLTWVTRDGRETPLSTVALDQPRNPRFSPDGGRLAVIAAEELWVYDVAGRPPIKLTSGAANYSPLWTPDGQRLVYEAGPPASTLMMLPADGSTLSAQSVSPMGHFHPYGWSQDGSELVAVRLFGQATGDDIVRWSLAKTDSVQPVVQTPANEGFDGVSLSPDGRWLAYASNQTGQQEIWVRPFPGPGAAVRVSPNSGVEPVWARNGRELYYLEDTQLMAVTVSPGDTFNFSRPMRLFGYSHLVSGQPPSYDVAPDGRFLVLKAIGGNTEAASPQIVVVQHWFEELKRLVPAN